MWLNNTTLAYRYIYCVWLHTGIYIGCAWLHTGDYSRSCAWLYNMFTVNIFNGSSSSSLSSSASLLL